MEIKCPESSIVNDPHKIEGPMKEAKTARMAELRKRYSGNHKALQQIDVYDHSNNKYHQMHRQLVEALKSNDTARITELEAWFKKYYPDL